MNPRLLALALALVIFAALATPSRAAVVISEIMYHPSSENSAEEYIELFNNGGAPVTLTGWQFTSGVTFIFPAASIPAGGYLVVAANAAAFTAKYPGVANYVAGWTGQLSNSANNLVLKDNLSVLQDEVSYADDGDWADRIKDAVLDVGHRGWGWKSDADGFGKSLELVNAAFENSHGQNWGASIAAQGTPGVGNSIALPNIAPVIRDVAHFPLVPKSTEAVTVTARILDELATGLAVTLHYKTDTAGSFTTVTMFDDGAHADALPGDGIYGASIPAQANGAIMEFYVQAADAAANARTWPKVAQDYNSGTSTYFPAQVCNALYQVDNTTYAGAMPLYRLVLKAADRQELTDINTNVGGFGASHARFNSTFITVDGSSTELRYSTGTRNRGHGSATKQPQSLSVAIPNDWDWKGRTSLNLNTQYTYLQLLGSAFMRRAGLPAPESRQIQMRVNNVDPTGGSATVPSFGFYVCNEFQDSVFADHHFPLDSSGNIYSIRRTDDLPYQEGDFTYLTPAGLHGADPYRRVYFKNTNASEDNWSDLFALTQSLAKGQFTTLLAAPTWDADYVTAVQAKVDVDEWMSWFAAEALVGNGETNLAHGYGDDFYFYIGITDPRARLVPYDMDTTFGSGDSPVSATEDIFQMIRHRSGSFAALTPTPMYPFLRNPTFGPLYFAKLQEFLNGPLSVANFNALADQILTGVVDAATIAARKAWYATRHAYISGLVIQGLSVTSGPTVDVTSGFPKTTTATCNLVGKTDPARTQSVKVNGVAATYVPWKVAAVNSVANSYTISIGEWSLTGVALTPGVNRLLIQAFDATAAEIDRTFYDVWYDDSSVVSVTGALGAGTTTWTAAGGPYRLTGNVTVPATGTLVIEPGTTVYVNSAITLSVTAGGRILAEGTAAQPINFTRAPGTTTNGGTITINGTAGAPETHFYYTFFQFGGNPAVTATANSNIILDYCEWLRTDVAYLHLDGGSFIVSNCVFPTPSASFEGVHGAVAPPVGGRAIIRDSFFGKTTGYNDVIDYTGGNRPGAIIQFYNNVFIGSDDDGLDIDGTDAWVEGNIFMHMHRNGSPDSSSAVSGGDDSGNTSQITIVGNLFYDVDQAATAKLGNFFTFLNNTVVDQNGRGSGDAITGVLNFADTGIAEAAGMYVEGNIVHSATALVRNYPGTALATKVTLNNNLLPPGMTWSGLGSGNTSAGPLLNDVTVNATTGASNIPTPTKDNYRQVAAQIRQQFGLQSASPARGTGPNGTDKGGIRPIGVSLSGAPTGTTNLQTATITVGTLMTGNSIPSGAAQFPGGSGWTHYQHRLDGGAFGAETPIATPITLSGLANGAHTLDVIGKNDAGTYQNSTNLGTDARLSSATWTVNTSYPPPVAAPIVQISEVLAKNTETLGFSGVFPDIIELQNVGNAPAVLDGWGLTDNTALPFKYTIANGTSIAAGARLVIYASGSGSVPVPKTGFGLKDSGDTLTLTRSAAAGGGVADSIAFGNQLPDYSIGRALDGSWALMAVPTFGTANIVAAKASPSGVKINEWLADAQLLAAQDFIELHNPGTIPVDIGGCSLTDNPAEWPARNPIRPLTFIHAGGYISFKADNDPAQGPDHLNFKLTPLQGEIGLFDPALSLIDEVVYGSQTTDISQGRTPNGALSISFFGQPTPGAPNPAASAGGAATVNVIPATQSWRYLSSAAAAPANDGSGRVWSATAYTDTAWPQRAQLFYVEDAALTNTDGFTKDAANPAYNVFAADGTTLLAFNATHPYQTYYFRTHFTYSGPLAGATLSAKIVCDDGAIIYLNGQEIQRVRVPAGANIFLLHADTNVSNAGVETIALPAAALVAGDNVIAVSVHQQSAVDQTAAAGSSDMAWGLKLDITYPASGPDSVVINEVLALNTAQQNPDGSFAGWVELYNTGAATANIADLSLTNDVSDPRKFVFPANTNIAAGGYLIVYCNGLTAPSATAPFNSGYALSGAGGGLFLYKSLANAGTLLDAVNYGSQLTDFSVGRSPNGSGAFALNTTTRAALNSAAGTTQVTAVKINEWLSGGAPGWLELYNTSGTPALLGGNFLTDNLTNKTKHLIPPLSFLAGSGASRWLQLIADNNNLATPGHVNFTIEAGEGLAIYDPAGLLLESVITSAQSVGSSQGRFPDGAVTISALLPTPAAANQQADTDGDGIPDAWETANGLNPNNPADAALDADGDGQSNLAEYIAGTNPQQAGSRLAAGIAAGTPGQFHILFTAQTGHAYTIQYKNLLTDAAWIFLTNIAAPGAPTAVDYTDSTAGVNGKRFYRVVTPQVP